MLKQKGPRSHSLETIEKIITLFVCENLTCYEIAERVGVSYNSIGTTITKYLGPKFNTSIKTIQSTWSTEE